MASPRLRALSFCGTTIVAVAAAAAACSSFSADDVAAADADIETSVLDAATTDAAVDADAGSFCAAHPEAGLCADFDEGDPATFHFTLGSGKLRVDDASAASPPAALLVLAGPDNASSWVEGQAIGAAYASRQRFSFDTYQGTLDGDGGADGATTKDAIIASLGHPAPGCTFDIEFFGDRARLDMAYPEDGGRSYFAIDLTAFPPPRTWAHVEMLLEQTPGVVVATLKINDVVALDRRQTKCPALAADPMMKLGLLLPGGAPSLTGEARYDNVLIVAE